MPQFPPVVMLRYDEIEFRRANMYPAWQICNFALPIRFDLFDRKAIIEKMIFYFALWTRREQFISVFNDVDFFDMPYFATGAKSSINDRFQVRIFLEKQFSVWMLTDVMWHSTHEPRYPGFDLILPYECC